VIISIITVPNTDLHLLTDFSKLSQIAFEVFGLHFERLVFSLEMWRVPIGFTGTEKDSRQGKILVVIILIRNSQSSSGYSGSKIRLSS